jgi:hypothetical protein
MSSNNHLAESRVNFIRGNVAVGLLFWSPSDSALFVSVSQKMTEHFRTADYLHRIFDASLMGFNSRRSSLNWFWKYKFHLYCSLKISLHLLYIENT